MVLSLLPKRAGVAVSPGRKIATFRKDKVFLTALQMGILILASNVIIMQFCRKFSAIFLAWLDLHREVKMGHELPLLSVCEGL